LNDWKPYGAACGFAGVILGAVLMFAGLSHCELIMPPGMLTGQQVTRDEMEMLKNHVAETRCRCAGRGHPIGSPVGAPAK
jgi:hypothetical protein